MKNTMTILLLMLSSTFLLAQAEVMELEAFNELDVSTSVKVTVYKGEPKAEITMVKGDREDLIIENRRGVLKIQFKSDWGISKKRKAEVKLYTNELSGVEVSAGGRVIGNDTYKSDRFYVEASSGGAVDMEVESEKIRIEVSSGGMANIDGNTEKLTAEVSSGGVLKGSDLRAESVVVEASSGGVAKVWSENSITAEASSGGVVKFSGEPKHQELEASKFSGGVIKKI